MPQQLLHRPQVGATAQHVGGEAVPQGVGAYLLVQPGGLGVLLELLPEALPGQPLAARVEEERLVLVAVGRVSSTYSLTSLATCS